MCHTGRCVYEDYMGNCTLKREECVPNYPDDAACVLMEWEQEQDEEKEINDNLFVLNTTT